MARVKLYKNRTIADRMSMFLMGELGFKAMPSRNKYMMFFREVHTVTNGKTVEHTQYLFLGKNGAVRICRDSKNAAKSISYTEKYQAALAQYEKLNGLMEDR